MAYQREDHANYMRNWYAERRASFFAGKSCAKCGATELLELDHIDPAQKITHRIWSWSTERRMEEIAKCQILCSGCHQEKTSAERAAKIRCGTEWAYHKGCRCKECRAAASEARQRRRHKIAA